MLMTSRVDLIFPIISVPNEVKSPIIGIQFSLLVNQSFAEYSKDPFLYDTNLIIEICELCENNPNL